MSNYDISKIKKELNDMGCKTATEAAISKNGLYMAVGNYYTPEDNRVNGDIPITIMPVPYLYNCKNQSQGDLTMAGLDHALRNTAYYGVSDYFSAKRVKKYAVTEGLSIRFTSKFSDIPKLLYKYGGWAYEYVTSVVSSGQLRYPYYKKIDSTLYDKELNELIANDTWDVETNSWFVNGSYGDALYEASEKDFKLLTGIDKSTFRTMNDWWIKVIPHNDKGKTT